MKALAARCVSIGVAMSFSTVALIVGPGVPAAISAAEPPVEVVSLSPARLFDSRTTSGAATIDGLQLGDGPLSPSNDTEIQIHDRAGVPASATAAVINITAIQPDASGFITAYPCGTDRPNASTLNYTPGINIANSTIIPIGGGGDICIHTSASTNLAVDITGYTPDTTSLGSVTPARLYDSRDTPNAATIDGLQLATGPLGAGGEFQVLTHGRAGVPATAAAAVVNITAIQPESGGFITAYPCGTTRPNASTLNYTPGTNVANSTIIEVSGGGGLCLFSSATTNLALDITGYIPDVDGLSTLTPARLFDSRTTTNAATIDGFQLGDGPLAPAVETQVQIHDRADVPSTATAAVINITAIAPEEGGFITAYPCGTTRPNASTLNYTPGINIANSTIIEVGTAGKVCLYSSATTHLAVDITGFVSSGDDPTGPLDPATAPATPREFTNAGFQRWCEVGMGLTQCTRFVAPGETARDLIPDFAGAAAVGVGLNSVCAQFPAGGVKCFGLNDRGQLGDGTTVNSLIDAVDVLGLDDARDVDAGLTSFACAARRTGQVTCWGDNDAGQLGQGDTDTYDEPVVVPGISTAVAVSAGGSMACALLGDGTVTCWGSGLLGDGNESDNSTPVAVLGLSDVSMISVGLEHACAVVATVQVACWGANENGQIGDGTTDDAGLTNVASGLVDVVAVAVGDLHSCARRTNGQVACWGKNDFGQTGVAPGADVLTPQIKADIAASSSIAAGIRFTVSSGPVNGS